MLLKRVFSTFCLFFLLTSLSSQGLESQFQHLLDSVYIANEGAVGVLVHVESPANNISWTTAVGVSEKNSNLALQKEAPVLLASNTKPYVAASILRLVELDKIALKQSIGDLLSEKRKKQFADKGYDLNSITVKHLLSHTSGIRDYVNDEYFEWIGDHPQHQWSKQEQMERALELGAPLSSPGTKYSYGDINYLLLTDIIENQTGKSFQLSIRELLKFEELGLEHTWFEGLESKPKNTLALAHQYASIYEWDSFDLNPSWDLYGGGGMASTVKESALFFQYLFEGEIIKDKELLEEMTSYVLAEEESTYCLGISRFDFGFDLYYHGGWWGTGVTYSPDTKASVAVFTLEKGKRNEINPFLGKTIQEYFLK